MSIVKSFDSCSFPGVFEKCRTPFGQHLSLDLESAALWEDAKLVLIGLRHLACHNIAFVAVVVV